MHNSTAGLYIVVILCDQSTGEAFDLCKCKILHADLAHRPCIHARGPAYRTARSMLTHCLRLMRAVRELAPPGTLTNVGTYPFEFRNVEMQYDSYRGNQVRCRYLIKVSVTGKGMTPDSKSESGLWVRNYEEVSEAGTPIKMEVGIEDCLHIEFEYDKARYHLQVRPPPVAMLCGCGCASHLWQLSLCQPSGSDGVHPLATRPTHCKVQKQEGKKQQSSEMSDGLCKMPVCMLTDVWRGAATQDVVVGRIHFLLVRIKLKHMEVEIRRRETIGAGTAAHSDTETLAKYEIMDGAPVRGESIPIRLYLSPYELSPAYNEVHNKFSVRYYLNLVLVDDEDRRYFKQQEITLYRRDESKVTDEPGKSTAPPAL
eukprot:355021-Chlamydomonas_euryale.AAC.19